MAAEDQELSDQMLDTLRAVSSKGTVHDTLTGRRMAGLNLASIAALVRRDLLHTVYTNGKRWIALTEAGAEALMTTARPGAGSEKPKTTLRITLDITVNTEDWKLAYGPNQLVRDDVTNYILNLINQSPAADECGLSAERPWR